MAKKPVKAAKKPAKKMKAAPAKKAAPKKVAPKAPAKKVAATADTIAKLSAPSKPKNTKTLSYTYSEFIENVRGFCGLNKRSQAKELCEDLARFLTDSLKKGYKIPLLGLGKLYVRSSKARQGINPLTKEKINIPARKRVRFTPAKTLKELVGK